MLADKQIHAANLKKKEQTNSLFLTLPIQSIYKIKSMKAATKPEYIKIFNKETYLI